MGSPGANVRAILIRGSNEVGSAVAHCLFVAGLPVLLHDEPYPDANRRTTAFSDCAFDGAASFAGVRAVRADDLSSVGPLLAERSAIPMLIQSLDLVLRELAPEILIDARMRKREQPEVQLGLAPLTIGLGPNFVAGEITDLIVETGWGDDLGQVSDRGSTRPLEGDPHPIDGHSRDRFVYAPAGGLFRTSYAIGQLVTAGETIASIDGAPVHAPLSGMLKGLTHDGARIVRATKVVEVDPRGVLAAVPAHIATRPARISEGILVAVQAWLSRDAPAPAAG